MSWAGRHLDTPEWRAVLTNYSNTIRYVVGVAPTLEGVQQFDKLARVARLKRDSPPQTSFATLSKKIK